MEQNNAMPVLAVRDIKAGFFLRPDTFKSLGQAERQFIDEVNDQKSMMCKHPQDYGLYLLGWYDEQEGKIESIGQPKEILSGISVKQTAPTSEQLKLLSSQN
nr:MAG: nonstructural protein [Microvirus sp.]